MTSVIFDAETGVTFRLLGGGDFCEAFEAKAPGINRFVLKRVRPDLSAEDASIAELLIKHEAGILARIDFAPGVVGFTGADLDIATLYLARAPGCSLLQSLNALGPMSGRRIRRIGFQWARTLTSLHGMGVVHADVKPANAVSAQGGSIRVIDFGSSEVQPTSPLRFMQRDIQLFELPPHTFIGSVWYAAPEQILGLPPEGSWDVYALGATMYHLASGQLLFDGTDREQIKRQHLEEDPRPINELVPDIHPDLGNLIMACLQKMPWARPSAFVLGRILDQLDI